MPSNRLTRATWRTIAPIVILSISLAALLVWSALMIRNAMLRNAEMLGTQLARTYAAEEEAHIDAFRLLLGYGRASVDELIDDGLTQGELEAWMHRFTDNATETLGGAMIDAYAVIDDASWRRTPGRATMHMTSSEPNGIAGRSAPQARCTRATPTATP